MAYLPMLASLAGPVLSAGIQGISGSNAAEEAASAQKKAAKLQAQSAANQLKFAKQIYGEGKTAAAEALPQQQQYLSDAERAALGYQQPFIGAGGEAINALTGLSGMDPASAQATIEAFKRSPIYQLNYQSMLDEAQRAVNDASAAGAGAGYNSGNRLAALTKLPGDILGRLFPEYTRALETSRASGQTAAGTTSQLAGNLGVNQANTLGSYVTNLANLGSNVVTGTNPAQAIAAQGALGQARVGGIAGPYGQVAGGIAGAAQPIGNALAQYYQPQPTGPTNIVPRGY
jgi:hypothetical protein